MNPAQRASGYGQSRRGSESEFLRYTVDKLFFDETGRLFQPQLEVEVDKRSRTILSYRFIAPLGAPLGTGSVEILQATLLGTSSSRNEASPK